MADVMGPEHRELSAADFSEEALLRDAAEEAKDIANRFIDFRDSGKNDHLMHLLHPDAVLVTLDNVVEGHEAIAITLVDMMQQMHFRRRFSPWRFVNHDLDEEGHPVRPRHDNWSPAATGSVVSNYNRARATIAQRDGQTVPEELSTRFVLERTGEEGRSLRTFSDWRRIFERETIVIVDGLVKYFGKTLRSEV